MDKLFYSYDSLHFDTIKICNWLKETGFIPKRVVGVARGGALPAIIISHQFHIPVELLVWSNRDSKIKEIHRLDMIARSAERGESILIVDDIVDSGETIMQIKERIYSESNIMFASLFFNPSQMNAKIDFWVNTIDRIKDKRWIVFPFEE